MAMHKEQNEVGSFEAIPNTPKKQGLYSYYKLFVGDGRDMAELAEEIINKDVRLRVNSFHKLKKEQANNNVIEILNIFHEQLVSWLHTLSLYIQKAFAALKTGSIRLDSITPNNWYLCPLFAGKKEISTMLLVNYAAEITDDYKLQLNKFSTAQKEFADCIRKYTGALNGTDFEVFQENVTKKEHQLSDITCDFRDYLKTLISQLKLRSQKEMIIANSLTPAVRTEVNENKKTRGRPKLSESEEKKRKEILAAWGQAKEAKVTRKQFCLDWNKKHNASITVPDIEEFQNWINRRKERKNS